MLALVARSPACVAAHDRDAWLALFSRDGVVEDPVGAAPNPRAALGRFYDTFIADNDIRFEVLEDLVAGHEVVRDVIIHTRLSTGLEIDVPAKLLYELTTEDGELRIRRMRAVWDLRKRSTGALAAGPRGLWTLCVISLQMLRRQGLGGVLGYSRGLVSGIFARGPATLAALATAINTGDGPTTLALFTADASVEFPVGTNQDVPTWLAHLGPGATLQFTDATAAGWLTAARFTLSGGPRPDTGGVVFFAFDPATRKPTAARFFVRPVPQSR
jgi:hypothetical protein